MLPVGLELECLSRPTVRNPHRFLVIIAFFIFFLDITHMKHQIRIHERQIIIRLRPEHRNLRNRLPAQLSLMLHQKVRKSRSVRTPQQRMPLVRLSPEVCPRPLTQLFPLLLETCCDKLVSLIITNAHHEEVLDVLNVRVVAVPETPEDVGEGAELREFGGVGGLAAAVPCVAGGIHGGIEEEAVDCAAGGADAEFVVCLCCLENVSLFVL